MDATSSAIASSRRGTHPLALELLRCRGGESAEFEVEACDAKGRLALGKHLSDTARQVARFSRWASPTTKQH
jgi:hypothetical protein